MVNISRAAHALQREVIESVTPPVLPNSFQKPILILTHTTSQSADTNLYKTRPIKTPANKNARTFHTWLY